jgi:hypothetical protein
MSKEQKKSVSIRRAGMILPLAVVIILVLAFIGIGLIQLGRNARLQAIKDTLKVSARCAADAGVEHAVRYMIDQWDSATNKNAWVNTDWYDAAAWTDPAIPATSVGYSFGTVNMGGTYGDGNFQYKIYKGTRAKGYQIVSTGTAGGVIKTVHAAVVLRSAYFGIGAKENIYVSPNTKLGTIPASDDFIIQTNSVAGNAITLKPNITVPGDVVCGPGGDPDVSINLAKNSVIQGQDRAAEDYIDFPTVYPPTDLPAANWSDLKISSNNYRITKSIKLSSISTTDTLYIGDPSAVNKGNITVYVTGTTNLNTHSKLIVNKGYSLTLYLGGNMSTASNAEIFYDYYANGTSNHPPDTDVSGVVETAKAISIKGTASCKTIHFQPNGDFYGTIYAPDASIEMWPNGDFYGAVIGGTSIDIKPGGAFMYIPSLVNSSDVEVLYMGVKHGSWWEE